MKVDCRGLESSVVRLRLLAAGLTLLAAGCAVLALSGSFQTAAKAGRQVSPGGAAAYHALVAADTLSTARAGTGVHPGARSHARNLFAGLPLIFEPNEGQANLDPADPRARFVARGSGYSLLLGSEGAILNLFSRDPSQHGLSKQGNSPSVARVESVEMRLAGANRSARLTGADPLPGKSNYLLGNDPAKWRRDVPQFARVRDEEIYPGIDLVFYGNQGRLEYDFQVAPGADPAQAELEFDGAKPLELKDGSLVIRGENGSVRLEAPRVYQEIGGREQPVEASFVLRGAHRAGFAIGGYDHARELVIDPVLAFSTYFGGVNDELATSVAVDSGGNIYLAGSTDSPNLATSGVYQGQQGAANATNVYIAKIQPPQGTTPASLVYVTYLGGTGPDTPVGIAVDGAGDPYVAGTTSSPNFPTTQTGYQTTPESVNQHVFVTELNSSASALLYSSYLSGNGTDIASGMTIDAHGYLYVTGTTTSVETLLTTADQFPATQLPQPLPYQNIPRYLTQFFVTKVNTNAPRNGSIAYSTYFGGGNFEPPPLPAPQTPVVTGGGIAVDTNGNIYFTGATSFTYTGCAGCQTTDFPILNAYQPCLDQPPPTTVTNPETCTVTSTNYLPDAFVAKLNPNAAQGEQLLWSTYLGGSQTDSGTGIALDSGAANVYVTGTTNSQDFVASATLATLASYQKCLNNLPPTPASGTVTCTTQTNPAPTDAFVARLSNPTNTSGTPTNVSLNYFSYLGGSDNEQGSAVAVDTASGALLTGWTQSAATNPPTAGSFPILNCADIQCALNPTQDAFVARINTAAATGQNTTASWASYFGGHGIGQGTGITLDVNGNTYLAGDTNATDLEVKEQLNPGGNYNGGYDAFVAQLGTAANLSISGILTLGQNQTYISAGNQATFTYTLTNNGPDLANSIVVTDNLSPTITGVPLTSPSASASPGTCSGGSTSTLISCTIQSLQAGSTATITIVVTPTPTGGQAQFNGGTVRAAAANGITTPTITVPAVMSDYSMTVSPANNSVPAAGDTATYQVLLTPNPVYGTAISLSITGLPPASSYSFSTNPVTLYGTSGATSILSISTTARPIITSTISLWARHFYAIWLAIPGLALLSVGVGGGRRSRQAVGIVLLISLLALLLLQPACSGRSTLPPVSGTPAGNYYLTVTATAGSDTKNASITLTVP